MKNPIVTTAIIAALISYPAFAAGSEGETVQLEISPEEADTQEGAQALYERIKTFAHGECAHIDGSTIRDPHAERCTRELITQFVDAIDKPLLEEAASEDPDTRDGAG